MRALFVLLLLTAAVPAPCLAEALESDLRINGKKLPVLFAASREQVDASVVKIVVKDNVLALGTVVSAKGHIVTKASELPESCKVKFNDGKIVDIEAVQIDRRNDLAVVKVARDKLTPVQWGPSSALRRGEWISAYSPAMDKLQVGVISATRRPIERTGGVIGVVLGRETDKGVLVTQVMPNSGALAAGVEDGDVITQIGEIPVRKRQKVIDAIKGHDAGEIVSVKIVREDVGLDLDVMLGHRSIVFQMFNRNQLMSGTTSKRRSGFEEIIQHDLFLDAASMGGPLLDLKGKAVGINIAKVNRVEIYTLPAEIVRETIGRLMKKIP